MQKILQDLKDEQDALDMIVADLGRDGWETKTHADWTVKEQIVHIAFFDGTAKLSATDPDAFEEHAKAMLSGKVEARAQLDVLNKMEYAELLKWWRDERTALLQAMSRMAPKDRLPWYGPSMSAVSFATARLMETWAHGQDVVDVVNGTRLATDRLYHIAHLGNITFGWSFANPQMEVPKVPVRVELNSPSGESWTWGPEDAEDIIRGSAEGFCLVVTQRRHYQDTDLVVIGETAEKWMSVAQCFAGPPTLGPPPGKFPKMSA
ncbi:MAG: TIGR03084 family protein [Deltaproteobacteria bacterium]|nr:TIGR03084 family protein [Deltaproteobacteria bacterium]MBW2085854.1 TIGR03084 family protein [Deltaproteobacteria bacterium]